MGGRATAQQVLWTAGTRLLEASLDEGPALLVQILDEIAELVGADLAAVAEIDRRSGAVTKRIGDPLGLLDELPSVRPLPADIVTALDEGPKVYSADDLFGPASTRQRGWHDVRVLTALIDEDDRRLTGVIFVGASSEPWTEDDLELMRGTGLLVRQFQRRVVAEHQVATGRALDRLALDVATALQGVAVDRFEAAMKTTLDLLLDALGASSTLLIDLVDSESLEIPYVASRSSAWAELGRLAMTPAIRARLAAEDVQTLAEPLVLEGTDLKADLLGELLPSGPGQREPRTVLLVPAAAGDAAESALALARPPDRPWSDAEIEVVSTVGAMIANSRALCRSELAAQARFFAQEALTDIGRRFVNVTVGDAIEVADLALRDLLGTLDAEFGAVVRQTESGPEVMRLWEGSERRVPGVFAPAVADVFRSCSFAEPTTLWLEADAEFRAAWELRSEGPWRVVWSPNGRLKTSYVVAVPATATVPMEVVSEAAAVFGDLNGQLQLRALAEKRTLRRLDAESVLSSVADDFLGGSADSQSEVETRALERIGKFLDLDGLVIQVFDEEPRVGSVWRSESATGRGVEPGAPLTEALRDALAAADESLVVSWLDVVPEHVAAVARERWGSDADPRVAPALVGGELVAAVVAIGAASWSDATATVLRSLATMVGQFQVRVDAERRDERRIRIEQMLADFAAELAEASVDTIRSVIEGAFARICTTIGLDQLTIWRVDRDAERYQLSYSATAAGSPFPAGTVVTTSFGRDAMLDRFRDVDDRRMVVEQPPSPDSPSVVACPFAGGGGLLLATSTVPGRWQPETLDLLRSVSGIVRDVESRVAVDRYADAAFTNSPIGIVLRDELLRLITCNDAYLRFVGLDDVEDAVGTMPNDFYTDGIEGVEWVDEAGALSGEAAFTRRDGTRVWGQLRASVIEGDNGENFWLVHVEDVTHRRRSEALLRFQATHDELTGLANRGRLAQKIAELAGQGADAAVLLLDLDRFKNINDSMGHDRGDEMLVAIADRLRLAVRPGDMVARLGGDEFAVVLPGPVTVTDAEMVADRLLRLISEPMWLGSQTVYPTASIGIAISETPEITDLLRRADTAMYRAKAQGRAQHASFDEKLQREVTARMATEAGLRGALHDGQFLVHYQPEVSTIDGSMLGAEALVRWDHPENGIIAASAFIEIAEETGLVVELGELVLREAVAEALSWPGGDEGPVVRVNLAAAQLQRDETVALVRSVLAESGLPPHRLCLEITESAVMTDITRSEEILVRLKEVGVLLAVDDFGTGFSSLAYLKRFPVDALKIDRAFVMGLGEDDDDLAFVRSIISLADALGLEVVAEGVETQLQARTLAELGCYRAQGYLYAMPGPAAALREHLAG